MANVELGVPARPETVYKIGSISKQFIYGFGWELVPVGSHKLVSHGGRLPGFRAGLARFVDDQLTVVVLTNSDNVNPSSLAVGIAALYLPGLIPERTAVRVDPKVLNRNLRDWHTRQK